MEVVKVQAYGCFVALNSQTQALVHVSELDVKRVSDPAELFQAGDKMDVKVLDKNQKGQLRLSRQVPPSVLLVLTCLFIFQVCM